jgi:hypothetical protein
MGGPCVSSVLSVCLAFVIVAGDLEVCGLVNDHGGSFFLGAPFMIVLNWCLCS